MKALAKLKVLDLSRILAGPYAAQILGDLGAQVIKVESPDGDETRRWGPPFIGDSAAYYFCANRNKRSFNGDFRRAEDLQHVKKLALQADVLIENFKVDSLKKFGLDHESLCAANPRLVYCSITGYGQNGSKNQEPGFDAMIQAEAGLMSVTGPAGQPSKVGVPIADLTTGLYAVIAIQAALAEREVSGLGQHIDLALYDVQASLLSNVAMNYLVTGKNSPSFGNAHPNIVPYQSFETADQALFLAVGNDAQFARLCLVLEKDWHQEERFATNSARVENRRELGKLLQAVFKTRPCKEWLTLCSAEKIPCGPINTLQDLAEAPLTRERELFGQMSDGQTPCLRSPMQFSRTPITEYRTPPLKVDPDLIEFLD